MYKQYSQASYVYLVNKKKKDLHDITHMSCMNVRANVVSYTLLRMEVMLQWLCFWGQQLARDEVIKQQAFNPYVIIC